MCCPERMPLTSSIGCLCVESLAHSLFLDRACATPPPAFLNLPTMRPHTDLNHRQLRQLQAGSQQADDEWVPPQALHCLHLPASQAWKRRQARAPVCCALEQMSKPRKRNACGEAAAGRVHGTPSDQAMSHSGSRPMASHDTRQAWDSCKACRSAPEQPGTSISHRQQTCCQAHPS